MTKEEKQKAIDALKISAPLMVQTQEEFNDYIKTIHMIRDWLEQETCEDAIVFAEAQRRDGMIDIRFYIPKDESIPTDLRLYVGENYVEYERTANGFLFKTFIDDEDEAMKVVQ